MPSQYFHLHRALSPINSFLHILLNIIFLLIIILLLLTSTGRNLAQSNPGSAGHDRSELGRDDPDPLFGLGRATGTSEDRRRNVLCIFVGPSTCAGPDVVDDLPVE